jgi:hypothetical protein
MDAEIKKLTEYASMVGCHTEGGHDLFIREDGAEALVVAFDEDRNVTTIVTVMLGQRPRYAVVEGTWAEFDVFTGPVTAA